MMPHISIIWWGKEKETHSSFSLERSNNIKLTWGQRFIKDIEIVSKLTIYNLPSYWQLKNSRLIPFPKHFQIQAKKHKFNQSEIAKDLAGFRCFFLVLWHWSLASWFLFQEAAWLSSIALCNEAQFQRNDLTVRHMLPQCQKSWLTI